MNSTEIAMAPNPLISVIIPVFNRGEIITGVINSLNLQSFINFEVIFIDDYSLVPLEITLFKLKDTINFTYRVERNEKNRGVSYSRNKGVAISKGEFICFLDSDDEWYPKKLEINLKAISKATGLIFAMSKTSVARKETISVLPKTDFSIYDSGEEYLFEHGHFAQVSSFFLSKALADKIKFNEALKQYEDFLYFIDAVRMAEYKIFVDETLVIWNDKPAPDRLSHQKDYLQAIDFLDATDQNIEHRFRSAFYVRFVMPYYFYSNVSMSFSMIYYCIRKSKTPKKTLLWLLFRSLLGPKLIEKTKELVKK